MKFGDKFGQFVLFVLIVIISSIVHAHARIIERGDLEAAASELRDKREHYGHGITGPVHSFVKTDKNANFKWGVRHHVGHKYAGK